ncbi:DUF4393 domain-containing protein [Pseudomonas sp. zbq_4]|uniref:DUF4393 domain-containing protein n=1 Tax=Pseudomonas sp. zbq_4 TaxID=3367240 RepID=UPI00370A48F2
MIDKADVEVAETATVAVGELIKAAGDTPEAKKAAQNIGRAAVTLTAAINNCLLPIAAVNFGFEKAKQYFGRKFQEDIAEATKDVPLESLIEPKPSLAGPALQALAFSHDELDLKDLYIKLLATSMDNRCASRAHPAFVEMLRQLTAKEARALQDILQASQIEICRVDLVSTTEGMGRRTLQSHVMNAVDSDTHLPVEDDELAAMVDNWVRLGLITVNYDRWALGEQAYDWMETRPEILKYRAMITSSDRRIEPAKGLVLRTALGAQFAEATGIIKVNR